MKLYDVEMDIHFSKNFRVEAENQEAAISLAESILLCTDVISLTDEDMIGLNSTAKGLEDMDQPNSPNNGEISCTRCMDCDESVCLGCMDDDETDADEENNCGDRSPKLCGGSPTKCRSEVKGLVSVAGKPMSLGEMMLHLSLYLEDAEDILESIATFARGIVEAKSCEVPSVKH